MRTESQGNPGVPQDNRQVIYCTRMQREQYNKPDYDYKKDKRNIVYRFTAREKR